MTKTGTADLMKNLFLKLSHALYVIDLAQKCRHLGYLSLNVLFCCCFCDIPLISVFQHISDNNLIFCCDFLS